LNQNKYRVTFETGLVEIVRAGCEATGTILAQAEQIKKGNRYEVTSIEKIDN